MRHLVITFQLFNTFQTNWHPLQHISILRPSLDIFTPPSNVPCVATLHLILTYMHRKSSYTAQEFLTILFNNCIIKIGYSLPSVSQICRHVLQVHASNTKPSPFGYNSQIYTKHGKTIDNYSTLAQKTQFQNSINKNSLSSMFWFTRTPSWKKQEPQGRTPEWHITRKEEKDKWRTAQTFQSHSKCSLRQGCVNLLSMFLKRKILSSHSLHASSRSFADRTQGPETHM